MINRPPSTQPQELNIVGSSIFGRYPKISIEKTYNMFESDKWMVDYAGYIVAIPSSMLGNGLQGRGLHTSTKLNRLICVVDRNVYLVNISFNQLTQKIGPTQVILIGQLQTSKGVVYISENNKPQILISDNTTLYVYDPNPPMGVATFSIATKDGTNPISFIPGYIDFHDTYFLCAASADGFYNPVANNTWRLSEQNNGLIWPDANANIGLIQTKPDNTQAVARFPSKGNMIFVFGSTVTEPWYDVGYVLFPYQRNTGFNIDYGCLQPATIASIDELVVWLSVNEKAGPVIAYSDGGMPKQITTDGIDYVLSNMQNPADSQAFIYRQDGHIFYHINFYTDNLSLFIDFLKDGTQKIYHACDEDGNYFIASEVAFFNNQYYFISKNNGNLYAFDSIFTTYAGAEIPRIRTCKSIRNAKQEPFVASDCGFTIETGETKTIQQNIGPLFLITQDGKFLITQGAPIFLQTQDGKYLVTQDDNNLVTQQVDNTDYFYLIAEQPDLANIVPRVDLSISIDGGQHFSSYDAQYLPPLGQRINKLMWWQLGWANDMVCQFRFYGLGRFVATDGVINVRQ